MYKVIKNYWADKIQEKISENEFKNHIESNEIKKCFVVFLQDKNYDDFKERILNKETINILNS